jgi:hypothetical protein
MTYEPTRADQIFNRFVAFHTANPDVFKLFEKFTLQLIGAGRQHYGIAAITERIRWHLNVDTKGDEVKINNDFKAYYARMFVAKHPQHAGFFQMRRRTSEDHIAYAEDFATFHTGATGNESALMSQLATL